MTGTSRIVGRVVAKTQRQHLKPDVAKADRHSAFVVIASNKKHDIRAT